MDRGREGYKPLGDEIRPEIEKPGLPEEAEQALREHDRDKVLEVAKNLDPKYHSEFAIRVLDELDSNSLAFHLLSELKGLNAEVSKACQNYQMVSLVGNNLDNFSEIDQSVAVGLAKFGSKEVKKNLFESLHRFKEINIPDLVSDTIDNGHGFVVLENQEYLSDLSHEQLVDMFIQANELDVFLTNLNRLPELDQQMVVDKIINSPYLEQMWQLFEHINDFDQLDQSDLVKDVLEITEATDEDGEEKLAQKEKRRLILFNNIERMHHLKPELVKQLVDSGLDFQALLDDLECFDNVDMEWIEGELVKGNRLDLIAYNIDRFPHIDRQAFVEKLNNGDPSNLDVLLRSLDKFPEFDHAALADKMIAEGKGELFAERSSNFDHISTNAADYLWEEGEFAAFSHHMNDMSEIPTERGERLIGLGQSMAVMENINKFKREDQSELINRVLTVEPKAVARYMDSTETLTPEQGYVLIRTGLSEAVLKNFEKFPGIDHERVARRLLQTAQTEAFFRYFDKLQVEDWNELIKIGVKSGLAWDIFPQLRRFKGINKDDLLDLMFTEEEFRLIAKYVNQFNSSRHQEISLQLLVNGLDVDFLRNVDKFKDLNWQELIDEYPQVMWKIPWNIPPEVIISLDESDQVPFRNGLDNTLQHKLFSAQFDKLRPYIEEGLVQIEIPGYSKEQLQDHIDKVLQNLQKKGLVHMAAQLAECALASEFQVDEKELEQLRQASREELERRENRIEREVDLGHHEVADEMSRFYVYQMIQAHLPAKRLNYQRWGLELPFKDRVALNDINRKAEPFNQELFEWMRAYGVHAVVSEMRHQTDDNNLIDCINTPGLDMSEREEPINDTDQVDTFLKYATKQEIGEYLHQASLQFRTLSWRQGFGGEPWAKIAETIAEAWQEKYPEEVICDRIFDLEHNSGMIFDKRPDQIVAESTQLQKILDFKFQAKGDVEEWLAKLPEMGISDQTSRSLTSALMTLKRIEPEINKLHSKYSSQFS